MIAIKIDFIIKQNESLEFVNGIIREFVDNIKKQEPQTLLYHSFQHSENPRHFFHLMAFQNKKSQLEHKNSGYCKSFVSKLYPLCESSPQSVQLQEIAKK